MPKSMFAVHLRIKRLTKQLPWSGNYADKRDGILITGRVAKNKQVRLGS